MSRAPETAPLSVRTVTVLGAGGTMGSAVAGLFAAYGGARVYITGRNPQHVEAAALRAARSVRGDSIRSRLIPVAWEDAEAAVAESDLIFESVAENPDVKSPVLARAAAAMRPDALLCTGTSGLSVTSLAATLPAELRSRFLGMHLFNPPGKMTLCELIPSPLTDPALTDAVQVWLETALGRHVVRTADTPAFLANRIGLCFLHEAAHLADDCRGKGGIDYADALFGGFTGRAMPPLATVDFIGLDVHAAIIRNLHDNTRDGMNGLYVLPPYMETLLSRGALGRKSGGGLFRQTAGADGSRIREVYDIASDSYRPAAHYAFPFVHDMCARLHMGDYAGAFRVLLKDSSEEASLCRRMLGHYLLYSFVVAEETRCGMRDADTAMACGFGWCPPLALADALRTAGDPLTLIDPQDPLCAGDAERRALENLRLACSARGGRHDRLSAYDFRPFFRAKED